MGDFGSGHIICAPRWVRIIVGRLEPMWRTVKGARSAERTVGTRPILYKRGLFQGDALSPLLFCLAILPLSHVLKKLNNYRIRHSTVKGSITHMLYMDDLKLYAERPAALTEAPSVVDRVASVVGMKLGLKKCEWHICRRGGCYLGLKTLAPPLMMALSAYPTEIPIGILASNNCSSWTTRR